LATIRAALDGRDPERRLQLLRLLYGEYADQVTARSAEQEGFQPCAKRTHRTVRDLRTATDPAGAAAEGDSRSFAAEEFVDLSVDKLVYRSLTLIADHWGMVDWDCLELVKLLVEIQLHVGATAEASASPALLETAPALASIEASGATAETGERRSSSSSLEIMFPTFAQLSFDDDDGAPCHSAESPDQSGDNGSDDGSASDDDCEEDGDSTSDDDYGDVQSEAAGARDMDLWMSDLDELVSDLEMLSRSSSLAANDSLECSDGSSPRSFDSR